jgi:hypothetical protein
MSHVSVTTPLAPVERCVGLGEHCAKDSASAPPSHCLSATPPATPSVDGARHNYYHSTEILNSDEFLDCRITSQNSREMPGILHL